MVTLASPSTIAVEKMSCLFTSQFCLWILHSHSMQAPCILVLLSLLWSDQSHLTGINWCYFLIGWYAAVCYLFGWWIVHPIDEDVSRSSWAAQCPKHLPTCSTAYNSVIQWSLQKNNYCMRNTWFGGWVWKSCNAGVTLWMCDTWEPCFYQHYWGGSYYTCWNQLIFIAL